MVTCLQAHDRWRSKFNCLNFISVIPGTKWCANASKTDANRVSTTQRSINQLETLHRDKPSRDAPCDSAPPPPESCCSHAHFWLASLSIHFPVHFTRNPVTLTVLVELAAYQLLVHSPHYYSTGQCVSWRRSTMLWCSWTNAMLLVSWAKQEGMISASWWCHRRCNVHAAHANYIDDDIIEDDFMTHHRWYLDNDIIDNNIIDSGSDIIFSDIISSDVIGWHCENASCCVHVSGGDAVACCDIIGMCVSMSNSPNEWGFFLFYDCKDATVAGALMIASSKWVRLPYFMTMEGCCKICWNTIRTCAY